MSIIGVASSVVATVFDKYELVKNEACVIKDVALERLPSLDHVYEGISYLKGMVFRAPPEAKIELETELKEELKLASMIGNVEVISNFFEITSSKVSDEFIQELFDTAILHNKPEIVNIILKNKGDQLSVDCLQKALISSCLHGNEANVLILLEDNRVSSDYLGKALIKLIVENNDGLVKEVLKKGNISKRYLEKANYIAHFVNNPKIIESVEAEIRKL